MPAGTETTSLLTSEDVNASTRRRNVIVTAVLLLCCGGLIAYAPQLSHPLSLHSDSRPPEALRGDANVGSIGAAEEEADEGSVRHHQRSRDARRGSDAVSTGRERHHRRDKIASLGKTPAADARGDDARSRRSGLTEDNLAHIRDVLSSPPEASIPSVCAEEIQWPSKASSSSSSPSSDVVILRVHHPTKGRRECDASRCNHAQYAALHGYRFLEHVVDEDVESDPEYRDGSDAPEVFYLRYAAALAAFDVVEEEGKSRTTWLLSLDCDLVIMDLNRRVEDLLDAAEAARDDGVDADPDPDAELSFVAARDPLWSSRLEGSWSSEMMRSDVLQVNAGVMLARHSAYARRLFDRVYKCDPAKTLPEYERKHFMTGDDFWVKLLGDQICVTYEMAKSVPGVSPSQFIDRAPEPSAASLARFGPVAIVSQRVWNAFDCGVIDDACDRWNASVAATRGFERPDFYREGDWMIHFAGQHGTARSVAQMERRAREALETLSRGSSTRAPFETRRSSPFADEKRWEREERERADRASTSAAALVGEEESPNVITVSSVSTSIERERNRQHAVSDAAAENGCALSLKLCPQCLCVELRSDGSATKIVDAPGEESFRGGSVARNKALYPHETRADFLNALASKDALSAVPAFLTEAAKQLSCEAARAVFFPADLSLVNPTTQRKLLKDAKTPLLIHQVRAGGATESAVWMPDFFWTRSRGFTSDAHGDVTLDALGALPADATDKQREEAWEAKIPGTFWRGSTFGDGAEGESKCATSPRVALAALSTGKSDAFSTLDAKITGLDGYGMCTEDALEKLGLEVAPKVPEREWVKHRAVIDIDGVGNAWGRYWRLASTSVVVHFESDIDGWYSSEMKPWVHYVPVSRGGADATAKSLAAALAWVADDANKVAQIDMVRNANALARSMTFESEAAKVGKALDELVCA